MSRRRSVDNSGDYSELRLCRQVERRLQIVFGGELEDPVLEGVALHSVIPGPPGQLVVRLLSDGSAPVTDILYQLEAARSRLRTEIAQEITRRKVPELLFRVREADEGELDQIGATVDELGDDYDFDAEDDDFDEFDEYDDD